MEPPASVSGEAPNGEPVVSCKDSCVDLTAALWKLSLPNKWLSPKPVKWIVKLKTSRASMMAAAMESRRRYRRSEVLAVSAGSPGQTSSEVEDRCRK